MSFTLERLLIKTKDNQFYVGYIIENRFEIPSINPNEENVAMVLQPREVEDFYIIDELIANKE